MADEKSLKFGTKLDASGIKQMQSGLKDLKSGLEAFNKSLSSLNKGFGDLNKELKAKVKDLGLFKSEVVQVGKVLTEQVKIVNAYTDALKNMNSIARPKAGQSSPATSGTRGVAYSYGSGSSVFNNAAGSGGHGNSPSAPLFVYMVGGTGGSGGGAGTQFMPTPGGGFGATPPQGRGRKAVGTEQMIQEALEGLAGLSRFSQTMKTLPMTNMASVQKNAHGNLLNQLAGGDYSSMLTMQRASTFQNIRRASGTSNMAAGDIFGGAAGVLGGAVNANATGNLMAPVTAAGGAAGDLIKGFGAGGYKAAEAANMNTALEASKGARPMDKIMMQHFTSTAAQRMALRRATGDRMGQVDRARLEFGMDLGESQELFGGLSNKFGASAVMGSADTTSSNIEEAFSNAKFFNPKQRAQFMRSPSMQAAAGVKTTTTPGMRGIGESAKELGRFGFDTGKMGDILGTLQMNIGGDKAKAGDQAFRKLEGVFRRATAAGIEDTALASKIGESVAQSAFGAGGAVSAPESLANAVIAAIRATTGGETTARDIDLATAGAQKLTDVSKKSPVLQAIRLQKLKRMGITSPELQQSMLSATTEELAGGTPTMDAQAGAAGIDPEKFKKIRQDFLKQTANLPGQFTGGNPSDRKIREIYKKAKVKHGDLAELTKVDPEGAKLVQTLQGGLTGAAFGGNPEEFGKGMGVISQVGAPPMIGPEGPIGRGPIAKELEEPGKTGARIDLEITAETTKNTKEILAALQSAGAAFGQLAQTQPSWEAANSTFAALESLINTIKSDPELNSRIQAITKDIKNRNNGL